MKIEFTSKTDLAQAYFPHLDPRSARHKLMAFINDDPVLSSQLPAYGYKPRNHEFSPVQVKLIFDRLGNPFA